MHEVLMNDYSRTVIVMQYVHVCITDIHCVPFGIGEEADNGSRGRN